MKSEAAPVCAQDTYEQPTIQFDDQVDVVFQLEPAQGQQQSTQAQQNQQTQQTQQNEQPQQPQQPQEQDTATKAP